MLSQFKLPPRLAPKFESIYDFEFMRELGKGAFATVYEAYHRKTDTTFAVKKLRFSQLTLADIRNIENEINIHSQLVHRNIVQFVDFLVEPKAIFMILEYMPKGNLFQHIRRNKLTDLDTRRVFYQVCLVMDYLHQRGIILRDLKPENILIDDKLNIKICDFGWATFVDNVDYCRSVAGTYCYMSPEGLRGELQSDQSDIWSLGVLLYELIFNREPFKGRSPQEMLHKIYSEGYTVEAGADREAVQLMSCLLRADARERLPLKLVMSSPYVAKGATLVCLDNTPLKTLHTEGSKQEVKSKTTLKPVEVIKRNQNVPNLRQPSKQELSTREQPLLGTRSPIAVPPLSSIGRKPFQNFVEVLNFSKAGPPANTSILTSIKARSPEATRINSEPRPLMLSPQPQPSSTYQLSSYKNKTCPQNPDPETTRFQNVKIEEFDGKFSNSDAKNVRIQEPGSNSKNVTARSPEPTLIKSRNNVTIDFLKRAHSPSIIASVNNSNIEVVFGDNVQEFSAEPSKQDPAILRDLAINRRMIFSSPGNKSPVPAGLQAPMPSPSFDQASKSLSTTQSRLMTPNPLSQPLGSPLQLQQPSTEARPVAKGHSVMDYIYKKVVTPFHGESPSHPPKSSSPPNENFVAHPQPQHHRALHHHPSWASPPPASHSTRVVGATMHQRPIPATQAQSSKAVPSFSNFLENMKSITRNW